MHRCEQPIIGALKGYGRGRRGSPWRAPATCASLASLFKMNAGYLSIGYTGTDMSGSFYLPKIVGYARACEILMNPKRFGAEKLYEWGFANKVVADDDVVEEAVALGQQICDSTAPFGLRLTKEALKSSLDGTSFETPDQDGEPQPGARIQYARRHHGHAEDEPEEQRGRQGEP